MIIEAWWNALEVANMVCSGFNNQNAPNFYKPLFKS